MGEEVPQVKQEPKPSGYQSSVSEGEEKRNLNLNDYHSGNKGGGTQFKKLPFLKAKNLPAKGSVKAVFTSAVREATGNAGYSDLYVDLRIEKKEYVLGLLKDSVLLGQLMEALGANGDKWKGKSVKLYRAKEKYINCAD
jgi:hypothetical protein